MRLRQLTIERFRGIEFLDWVIDGEFVLLVGPGDSGKSTILDAIGWVLRPSFSLMANDADFYNGDTDADIVITAVVCDVPDALTTMESFGHFQGRWLDGELLDGFEEEDGEAGIRLELRIDATLEPSWTVISGNESRRISARDRAQLGLVEIDLASERHLGWSRGSALGSETGVEGATTPVLVEAHRAARRAVWDADVPSLNAAAAEATAAARNYDVPVDGLRPGLAPQHADGPSRLLLHEGVIPLRARGTGSRRLASLALQGTGDARSVLCIDEIELALEPHRLRAMIAKLADAVANGKVGHAFATTHSAVALIEADASAIHVVRRQGGRVSVRPLLSAMDEDAADSLRRANSYGLLAPSVLVGEGRTEVGFFRSLMRTWSDRGWGVGHLGVECVDGGGDSSARKRANGLAGLGYRTAILLDADRTEPDDAEALSAEVARIVWPDGQSIESQLFRDIPPPGLAQALEYLVSVSSIDSVRDRFAGAGGVTATDLSDDPETWFVESGMDDIAFAEAVTGTVRNSDKSIPWGERLGQIVGQFDGALEGSQTAEVIDDLRVWASSVPTVTQDDE